MILEKFGYVKGEQFSYLSKRVCGLWLLWVSVVILIGTILGGSQKINMKLFDFGYFLGFILILGNRRIYKRLSYGKPSKFQKNMTFVSIILMFILLVGLGGHYFATNNYRMIWLSAFLAIGIHFIPFSIVHGKIMLPLALLISINALAGIWMPSVSFSVFAYLDVVIKALFGLNLLISKNPLSINNEESKTSSI
ncbi:DUF6609 family protein [Neobacillus cucumis]|uniref:DUF6609 family protein n=1 Tax=Neobacillus cucumis TaxID=1740721 RepID=UPI0019637E06|nr:DUF6609 family protein [Neobacillus cucumis]MBM7654552.1 hypothetical protein [Neobacillus cucumis]